MTCSASRFETPSFSMKVVKMRESHNAFWLGVINRSIAMAFAAFVRRGFYGEFSVRVCVHDGSIQWVKSAHEERHDGAASKS